MKIVPIDQIPKKSDLIPIKLKEIGKIAKEMVQLCEKEKGAGLAAVQVGLPHSFFIARMGSSSKFRFFYDCKYIGFYDKSPSIEGCLSLKDISGNIIRYEVDRWRNIRVIGREILLNKQGARIIDLKESFQGLEAVLMAHEIDHTFGILISQTGRQI